MCLGHEGRGNRGVGKPHEFNDLYCSPNNFQVFILKRMRRAGHVASMDERRGLKRVLLGKPEGKKPHARPRR
jgi:hypothetical protein